MAEVETDAFLIYGEPSSPDLRHELQVGLAGAAAVLGADGRRLAVCGAFDRLNLESVTSFDVVTFDDLGLHEALLDPSMLGQSTWECLVRACREFGITSARVPPDFPLEAADYVRNRGIGLTSDRAFFEARRRAKTPWELDGIREALAGTHAAMAAVRRWLFEDGAASALTVEDLRTRARQVLAEHGCVSHDVLAIAPGSQSAIIHPEGAGVIGPNEPILVDIFPRHLRSGCWGDLARTFCLGEPPARLVELKELVERAQALALAAVAPGVTGDTLNAIASEVLEEAGYPTLRSRGAGEVLEEGFAHRLGHGLGLEIHEAPSIGVGCGPLVVGDVITLEPGLYVPGFGGFRVEDVVVVTDEGSELLTSFPHEFAP